jgi:hypothetical protein
MGIEHAAIRAIVLSAVQEAYHGIAPAADEVSDDTLLAGDGGVLTSLDLVTAIVAVEARIAESCSTEIVLFDDALIADPNGPFRTVGALVQHVYGVVERAMELHA